MTAASSSRVRATTGISRPNRSAIRRSESCSSSPGGDSLESTDVAALQVCADVVEAGGREALAELRHRDPVGGAELIPRSRTIPGPSGASDHQKSLLLSRQRGPVAATARPRLSERVREVPGDRGLEREATIGPSRPSTYTSVRRPSPRSAPSSGTSAYTRSARTNFP